MAKVSQLDPKTERVGRVRCTSPTQPATQSSRWHCAQQGSPVGKVVPMLRAHTNEEMKEKDSYMCFLKLDEERSVL